MNYTEKTIAAHPYPLQVVSISADTAKKFFGRVDEPIDLGPPPRPEEYMPSARIYGFPAAPPLPARGTCRELTPAEEAIYKAGKAEGRDEGRNEVLDTLEEWIKTSLTDVASLPPAWAEWIEMQRGPTAGEAHSFSEHDLYALEEWVRGADRTQRISLNMVGALTLWIRSKRG